MKKVLLILFLIVGYCEVSQAQSIIVNAQNSTITIPSKFVKDIFIGNMTRWKNNSLIEVVDYNANTELRTEFTAKYIEMSVMRVYKNWIRLSLSAEVAPPKIFHTQQEVIDFVSKNANAIGYIKDRQLISKDSSVKEVKILEK